MPNRDRSTIDGPLVMRHGVTIPLPRGMNREANPGKIPVGQFYDLINVRVHREVISRGGQEKTTSSALNGCIDGIFDDGNPQA